MGRSIHHPDFSFSPRLILFLLLLLLGLQQLEPEYALPSVSRRQVNWQIYHPERFLFLSPVELKQRETTRCSMCCNAASRRSRLLFFTHVFTSIQSYRLLSLSLCFNVISAGGHRTKIKKRKPKQQKLKANGRKKRHRHILAQCHFPPPGAELAQGLELNRCSSVRK